MATSKKPRKAYRSKGVALTPGQKRDMELAVRIHIHKLWLGALDSPGWNTLAAHLNVCAIIANDGRYEPAMAALDAIRDRKSRTGVYGATGDERNLLMDQFNDAVEYLSGKTDMQVANAVQAVYRMCA